MVVVFNQLPLAVGNVAQPFNPFVQRAATAAAEVTNEIYWRKMMN